MKTLLIFLLLVGCAPLTEQQRYEREANLAEAKDKYFMLERACRAAGGYMIVHRPVRDMRNWNKFDFGNARCAVRNLY